jgi:hypothetical protein
MKKNRIIALVAVSALILALFIYYDKMLVDKNVQTIQEPQGIQVAGNDDGTLPEPADVDAANASAGAGMQASGGDDGNAAANNGQFVECETVHVDGNTPEYEFKLELCEDTGGRTFIRMEYYLDGFSVVNELDDGQLTELAGIFEKRKQEDGKSRGFRIGQALLNPVMGQLYLLIHGIDLGEHVQASFYKVNIRDLSIRKLFSYPALYGKMSLNADCSLLAYSFKDPAIMSFYQEDYLLDVYDCKNEEYLVRGNRDGSGKYIGSNSNPDILYDYEFIEWQSGGILKLKQGVRLKTSPDEEPQRKDVLYDIQKNLLKETDGSILEPSSGIASSIVFDPENGEPGVKEAQSKNAAEAGITENSAGSAADVGDGPESVIRNFYSYLESEDDYAEAMLLLDDGFRLRMAMLKQFGIDEVLKSDIDAEYEADNASLYSNLLKAAKLESITDSKISEDGSAKILYYHVLALSGGSGVRQQMSAELKKTGKGWKIILIEDGIQ